MYPMSELGRETRPGVEGVELGKESAGIANCDGASNMEALKEPTGYTYWVREDTHQAAPAPVARRLTESDIAQSELQSRVEMKNLEGTLKVIEATYGDLDDLQVEVSLEKKSVPADERSKVSDAIGKSFLPILRAKLEEFEAELKER